MCTLAIRPSMRVSTSSRRAATSENTSVSRRSASYWRSVNSVPSRPARLLCVRPDDADQLLRIANRVDAQHQPVEHGEHRGGEAEPQRDGSDNRQRHRRRPAEPPPRVDDVAHGRLDERHAARVTAFVGRECGRPETHARTAPRHIRRQSVFSPPRGLLARDGNRAPREDRVPRGGATREREAATRDPARSCVERRH